MQRARQARKYIASLSDRNSEHRLSRSKFHYLYRRAAPRRTFYVHVLRNNSISSASGAVPWANRYSNEKLLRNLLVQLDKEAINFPSRGLTKMYIHYAEEEKEEEKKRRTVVRQRESEIARVSTRRGTIRRGEKPSDREHPL